MSAASFALELTELNFAFERAVLSSLISSLTVVGISHGLGGEVWSNSDTAGAGLVGGAGGDAFLTSNGGLAGLGCRTVSNLGLAASFGCFLSYSLIIFSSSSVLYRH